MNKIIKDYLTFTSSERNGLIVLVSIMLVLVLFLKFPVVFYKNTKTDFSKFENEIENFQKSLILKDSVKPKIDPTNLLDCSKLSSFDPNFSPDSIWKQFGLSEKQIKVINNYLSKGGKFYKKEDIKKMYCINNELYQILEPYIIINSSNKSVKNIIKNNLIIDINSADTTELKKIHNLNIYTINRIIKYRDLLGGFFRKEQLLEVYGLKQELYKSIEKHLFADSTKIVKLNINTATINEFNKSPYIDYSDAKGIVNFRLENSKFNNIYQILNFKLLSKEKFDKVRPYLSAE